MLKNIVEMSCGVTKTIGHLTIRMTFFKSTLGRNAKKTVPVNIQITANNV